MIPADEPPLRLFVYGTLMSGQLQAGLLAHLDRVPARVRGALYELPAGYPALAPGGDGLVHGELLDAPPAPLLGLLDTYEGVSESLFRRDVVPVLLGLRTVQAWAYVMDAPERRGGRPIRSGQWRAARRR